jgi:hypothetical protein
MSRYLTALLLSGYLATSWAQDSMDVCIDYHCEKRQVVKPDASEWKTILSPFNQPSTSASQERQQIRQSIALFEQVVGAHTPTHRDRPQNEGEDEIGQLDCIAESTNTRSYLQQLAMKKKLKWHQVEERVRRSPLFFDVHWGVKITDLQNQQTFVVDSWYGANAELPEIQPLDEWLSKR